jgi:hypothetical protein
MENDIEELNNLYSPSSDLAKSMRTELLEKLHAADMKPAS